MDTRETYNRIAEDWYREHQDDDWWVEGTDTFISYLAPGANVLDIGCGAGTKSKYLTDHGLKVTGIDFSEKLIEIAKREVPEAEFRVMDMRDIASLPGEFDALFAQASLLHIARDDIQQVLVGFMSKLREGGYLYVAVKGAREGSPLEEVKKEDDYGYEYERFFSYYTLDELKGYFAQLGLEVTYESSNRVGRTDWLQIIGKK